MEAWKAAYRSRDAAKIPPKMPKEEVAMKI